MQTELINKLQKVAEYDGWHSSTYHTFTPPNVRECFRSPDKETFIKYPLIESDFKYHISFDWSIPVWAKALKEANELSKQDPIYWLAWFGIFEQNALVAINNQDPQAFFDNLYNLIVEIEKFKAK